MRPSFAGCDAGRQRVGFRQPTNEQPIQLLEGSKLGRTKEPNDPIEKDTEPHLGASTKSTRIESRVQNTRRFKARFAEVLHYQRGWSFSRVLNVFSGMVHRTRPLIDDWRLMIFDF